MTYSHLFGAFSTLMMLGSRTHYFNEIFRGRVKPHLFSWLIWGTISSIGFAAQVSQGAGAGAWSRGLGAATCFIIVMLAFSRGEKNVKKSDWVTLILGFSAIPLWMATKTPLWSVVLVSLIDAMGCYPTLRKAWMKPHEEAVRSFGFSFFSAVFSIIAIENYSMSTWLYPLEGALANAVIVSFLIWRRHALRQLK